MKEWPIFSIGIVAASTCCLLTPIVLALVGTACLRAIAGELFLPLLIGPAALAALALEFTALARRRRSAHDCSHKKA